MNSIRKPHTEPLINLLSKTRHKALSQPTDEPSTQRRRPRRPAAAILAAVLAGTLAFPVYAGGGWGWNSPGYYHGHRGHHGYHGHHGHYRHDRGGGSSDGWIAAGVLALVGAGIYLAVTNNRRDAAPYPSYSYTDQPQGYGAPSYDPYYDPNTTVSPPAIPEAYPVLPDSSNPNTVHAPGLQYGPGTTTASVTAAAQANPASPALSCERQAINQSGYDPATRSEWTTQVAVDTYQRALQACRSGAAG